VALRKPVLVLYTADWCPPCRLLKREVLSDPKIDAFLAREYVRVKIDLTNRRGPNNRLAAKAQVTGLPTMIVFNHRRVETARMTGGEIGAWIRSEARR
jgi:thiol:disulfide interchange protein DsbD